MQSIKRKIFIMEDYRCESGGRAMYHQSRKQRYFKDRQVDQNTRVKQLFERLGQYEDKIRERSVRNGSK